MWPCCCSPGPADRRDHAAAIGASPDDFWPIGDDRGDVDRRRPHRVTGRLGPGHLRGRRDARGPSSPGGGRRADARGGRLMVRALAEPGSRACARDLLDELVSSRATLVCVINRRAGHVASLALEPIVLAMLHQAHCSVARAWRASSGRPARWRRRGRVRRHRRRLRRAHDRPRARRPAIGRADRGRGQRALGGERSSTQPPKPSC